MNNNQSEFFKHLEEMVELNKQGNSILTEEKDNDVVTEQLKLIKGIKRTLAKTTQCHDPNHFGYPFKVYQNNEEHTCPTCGKKIFIKVNQLYL